MTEKKKKQDSFQTFKLFGKQAQKLIDSARTRIQSKKKDQTVQSAHSTSQKSDDGIFMHLSIMSVVKATFAIVAIAAAVFICYQIRDKLLILFLAVFLSVVIDPGVSFLERLRIPRGFAIFFVYIVALAMLLFLVISLIPILAEQIQQMATRLAYSIDRFLANPILSIPLLGDDINSYLNTMLRDILADVYKGGALQTFQQFGKNLSSAAQGSIHFVVGVAGSVLQFVVKLIFVLVLCFFIQLEKEKILRWARVFLPYRLRRYFDVKAEAIHIKLGHWIRGQLILSLSIGILVFIVLKVLGMQYALTLAVLAFFAEFVPVAGPIIAAIPAVFIALAQSGFFSAMIVAVVYYGIQWCENNLLVPLIMQRAVGLSPIAVIFAMMVGISFPSTIHPVLGVLLAVPVATILSIFIKDYREWQGINDR
jgi:predicted PurR-regulated permease PerM